MIRILRRHFASIGRTQSFASEEYQIRRELAIAHRLVAHYDMDELTWNHISARVGNEGKFLVTPVRFDPQQFLLLQQQYSYDTQIKKGNKHFALMEPDDLVLMGSNDSDLKNVTANVIHSAIFEARPDVRSILHVHTEAGQYVSCLPGMSPLVLYTQDGGGFFGKVGVHEFSGVATDREECEIIAKDVTRKTITGDLPEVLIMRSHGTTTMGTSIGAAFVKNFYLDRVCRIQMNLDQTKNSTTVEPLSDVILRRMAAQYKREDIMHGCEWPAMVEYAEKHLGCDFF